MTAGGKDGWPIFVGAYGLIGSIYPDQAALVEGLWTGSIKWNDAKSLEMWEKMQVYARDMMEEGASGIAGDAAPGRFASGAVAMFSGGTWYGPRSMLRNPPSSGATSPSPAATMLKTTSTCSASTIRAGSLQPTPPTRMRPCCT
jgi:raffinose/stachyose/melibiose transport system substrate-binding protein